MQNIQSQESSSYFLSSEVSFAAKPILVLDDAGQFTFSEDFTNDGSFIHEHPKREVEGEVDLPEEADICHKVPQMEARTASCFIDGQVDNKAQAMFYRVMILNFQAKRKQKLTIEDSRADIGSCSCCFSR
jgi:hypothetical protein